MARSSVIAVVTLGSVGVAAIISVAWFLVASGASRFEPAVQLLGLLAGLAGLLAERRAAARERRRLALTTLTDELDRDEQVLADPRFVPAGRAGGAVRRPQVYPRLPVSAIDAVLVSGVLTEPGDAGLLNRLHAWRDEINGFNRRLDLTEMRIFAAGAAHEAGDFERALHRSDGHLDQIRCHLRELKEYLGANKPPHGRTRRTALSHSSH